MSTLCDDAVRRRFAALDTPSVADAMDSVGHYGALPDIHSRVPGQKTTAGRAHTVVYRQFARNRGEFHNAGNYIDHVKPGEVIVVDNEGRCDCTVWGDILTETALLKGIAGTVIHGAARDIAAVQMMGYPLFSTAVHMVSGKNRVRVSGVQAPLQIGTVVVNPGDWIVADANGVLAVPAALAEDVLTRAERIDNTEQRIRQAVREGEALEAARARHRYDRPWEETVPT